MSHAPFLHPIEIGELRLASNLCAAPMAQGTKLPFRILVKEQGCALAWSEMANAHALVAGARKARGHLEIRGEPRPLAAQISGADATTLVGAARLVEDLGFDTVDVNMGCPQPRYTDQGAGAALMRDVPRAARIVAAIVGAVRIPVTVKMRAGWDPDHRNAPDLALAVESAGARLLTVHGRTRADGFRAGTNDLAVIARVKEVVHIPVLGNGDVRDGPSARRMFEATGCDGIAIGRAACGRPWIFASVRAFLEDGTVLPPPPLEEVRRVLLRHFRILRGYLGERAAVVLMRQHAGWYVHGLPGAACLRKRLQTVETEAGLLDLVGGCFDALAAAGIVHLGSA